jgi:glutamate---cysteine ligase / carboxylate-amine ligase
MKRPPLTLGIEEEYMIVDAESRALSPYNAEMIALGREELGDQLKTEFMQSQIEIGTKVCENIGQARLELAVLRRVVAQLARDNNKRIASAATHPFSRVHEQTITDNERYHDLYTDLQYVGRRLLIFGMHVHIGFGTTDEAKELTIDIMNQLRYFLPHILALSTSSPFWHGRNTGLKSYRCVVFESLPRTGIPPIFNSYQEYDHMVETFAKVGSLAKGGAKDPSRLWWDVRPSPRYGTLEIRAADVCSTAEETLCIAAVIQALVAKLIKLRMSNQSWRLYRTEFIRENKWRASRYGIDGDLVDFGIEKAIPARLLWEEILSLIDDVVDEFGSRREVEYVRTILAKGTSADRQLAAYTRALDDGLSEEEAVIRVVDHLVAEFEQGI